MKRLAFLAALTLFGCSGKDEVTKIFPTVQQVVGGDDHLITCHPWDGDGPDRTFRRERLDDNHHPRLCMVGDICFYGCPRP